MKTLYTAVATAKGGRAGKVSTDDGKLNLTLSVPRDMKGDGGEGTNPEQLFAAGYSACFGSALELIAKKQNASVEGAEVTANVSIGSKPDGGFQLAVRLDVSLPNVDHATAQDIVEKAHQVCPYSNATRGNIDVELHVKE